MNLKDKRFTRNEQLTKALKMELIPTEATKRTIQIDNLLGADEKLRAAAASLQPLYDSFVRTVISKATPFEYDYTNLITSYIASIIDSEEKATSLYGIDISKATPYKDAKALFIKQFTEQLKSVLPEGVKSFSDITSQAFIKDIMPELLSAYPEGEEKTKMSEVLKGNIAGFAVLNRKYATSRATALATWVPERLIENLEIFASNIPSFRKFIASADSVDFVVENPEMLSMAFPDGYAACTSPAGIDGYNLIINGLVLEDGVKAKGYNALVNELNQNHKSDKTYDGPMYRKANVLYQQIMMPKAKAFVIESLEQDDDVRECLKEMHHASSNEMLDTLVSLVRDAAAHSIPVLGRNIQPLSHVITGNHNKLGDIIKEAEENRLTAALAECSDKEEKKNIRKNLANIAGYVSKKTYSVEELRKLTGIHIMSAYQSALEEVCASVISAYNNIKNSDILTSASIFRNSKAAKLIGAYMDALTGLRDLIRLITANDTENPAFVEFMNKLDDVRADMKYTIKGTNLIRNYLTRAPKDIAKEYETCFGTSALFDSKWWNGDSEGVNSHIDNGTNVLLRDKGGKLYFFRNSGSSGYFTMMPAADGEEYYEAFTTCKAQSANKQMPKITFPVSLKRAFAEDPKLAEYVLDESNQMQTPVVISRKLYDMYSKGLHKKDAIGKSITEEEYKANLATIIGKYIEVINSYKVWNCFTFDFKAPECYGGLMEFFDYVDTLTCVVNWVKVSKPYIDALCDNRRALMFQINHRDLYKDKRNLDANAEIILRVLDSSVSGVPTIKLNSRPRITFRPAIFPVSVTHPAGSILLNKKDKLGRHIPAGIYREIYRYLNGHATTMSADASEWYKTAIYKTARYDIIKDKTYTRDAYFIAFTYTKNVGSNSSMRAGAAISANAKADMGEYRTLSVVRGTKDLLYYVLL